jgi:glycosyltransferase involved in cell wall biosynthesis
MERRHRLVGREAGGAPGLITMTSPMHISVVICTYNRASRLAETLEHFQKLTIPAGVTWELVVVNNRSSDNTDEVITQVAARTSLPLRKTFEPFPGLGAARNRGIAESKGTIVAFTDDDIFPATDWLVVLAKEFSQDPQLAGIGGRVELHNPLDLPVTIRTSRERFQMVGTWNLLGGIPGCNMAFRREVIEQVGGFDPDFGAGAPLVSAEDIEFIFRCIRANLKLVYSPDLLVTHDHGRRTQAQVDGLMKSYLVGRGAMYAKHILKFDPLMIKMAGREALDNSRQTACQLLHGRIPRRPVHQSLLLFSGFFLALRRRLSLALGRSSRSSRSPAAA